MTNDIRRPNILFAVADDASHMSAFGHRFVRTPNFDRVAEAGILFLNAFTPNPKCAPSRACILTGRHTWQLEEACNHYGLFPAKFPVYPDLLEQAGYVVGFTGKGWAPGDWKRGGRSRNPAGPAFNERTLTPPAGTRINRNDYAANFADFLAQRPADQPFCFWYGGFEPHRPYEPGEGLRAGKRTDTVDVPAFLPNVDVVREDLLDYANEIEWFDRHLGLMLDQLEAIGELDNTLVVVTSDNGMPFPRVKGNMYEPDFHLPMALCWPAATPGGRRVEDLISFVDLAPTFLAVAGVEAPAELVGRSLLSIVRARGSGRIEPERDRVFLGRERHDVGREGDVGYPVRCLRTPTHLYVRNFRPELWPVGNPETGYTGADSSPTKALILAQHARGEHHYYNLAFGKRPAEELYQIVDDPECLHNLAYDPAQAALRERLWQELRAELERTDDPRIFGNGAVFDGYEYVGKSDHSWRAYIEGRFKPQTY